MLDEAVFDAQHHAREGQRVGHDGRGVEELKIQMDLEADAVGAAEELDHQNDFPDHGQPVAGAGGDERPQLRPDDVAQAGHRRQAVDLRHVPHTPVERADALSDGDGDHGGLVEGDGDDGRDLVQADPEVAEHDDHQRGQVQKDGDPRVEPHVEPLGPAHGDAEGHADGHGEGEGESHAAQGVGHVVPEGSGGAFVRDLVPDGERGGQDVGVVHRPGAERPGGDQQGKRDQGDMGWCAHGGSIGDFVVGPLLDEGPIGFGGEADLWSRSWEASVSYVPRFCG